MLLAVFNDGLVHGCIAAIGYNSLGILQFTCRVPHHAAIAYHNRHRSINNHIVSGMQTGDTFV